MNIQRTISGHALLCAVFRASIAHRRLAQRWHVGQTNLLEMEIRNPLKQYSISSHLRWRSALAVQNRVAETLG